jgi:hypothetical protein
MPVPNRPSRHHQTRSWSSRAKVDANLLQLMRRIPYPASNVVFAAQEDVSKLAPVADPSVSPNPLTSTYEAGRPWRMPGSRWPNPPT